jgi:hypothetical protein
MGNTLSWKQQIGWLMSKLGLACYAIRTVKPYMLQETKRMIYFSHFHSVMTYCIILWGYSLHSIHIFRLILGVDSCQELFISISTVFWPCKDPWSVNKWINQIKISTHQLTKKRYTPHQWINTLPRLLVLLASHPGHLSLSEPAKNPALVVQRTGYIHYIDWVTLIY